jgi:hypothetical protein
MAVITLVGCGGGSSTATSNNQPPTDPVPTATLNVSPGAVSSGESATLLWVTTNATSASMTENGMGITAKTSQSATVISRTSEGIIVHYKDFPAAQSSGQTVPLAGSMTVNPRVTITYTLTVTGLGGTATAQTTLQVTSNPPPTPSADALVKTYNVEGFSGNGFPGNGKTMRWPNGTVAVYDETGFAGLQSALSA